MKAVVGLAVLVVLGGLMQVVALQPANSADASRFKPGLIISDEYFYDSNAMTTDDIQSFLQSRIRNCSNANCLNVVKTTSVGQPADAMCGALAGGQNESAASIIFRVQRACGISAKVLLVTLEKEQSLVSATAPSLSKLDRAMGYACPDNTAIPGWCEPAYAGLFNQIYLAARQLKRYANPPGTSNFFTWYPVGQTTNVQFNPNPGCGSSAVTIENKATAALYYYTPYQPNAAALANLYGVGDECGAYGNRNFWRIFSDWFGDPVLPSGTPTGELKDLWTDSNVIRLWGWAVDLDQRATALAIHIKVDDIWVAWTANAPNSSAEALYPGSGPNHGFGGTIAATPGSHRVCVYAVNLGPGSNLPMACRDVVVPDGSPIGELKDLQVSTNAIQFWGWAADRDNLTGFVPIHVLVNGKWSVFSADQTYPAPASALAGVGSRTGFGASMAVASGSNSVCVFAVNTGAGSNTTLGCRTVVVPDGSPIGEWKDATASLSGITIWGWGSDPDGIGAIADVHIKIDDEWAALTANKAYPAAVPGLGGDPNGHGWSSVLAVGPGSHTVCGWVVNSGPGSNLALGCRTLVVPSPAAQSLATGAVAVRGPSSQPVPGAVVEVRAGTCAGAPVWRGTTASQGANAGAFGIGLIPGQYCLVPLVVPAGYSLPAESIVQVSPGPSNWFTVWAPVGVTGAVVAKDITGAGVDGVVIQLNQGPCASQGPAVWLQTTSSGRWSSGGFGISLPPGTYCVSTLTVPPGFSPRAAFDTVVASPSPYWITVWL